jgi:DNA topoisomerase-1
MTVAVPGLRYVSDEAPGIRRRRAGKGFVYTGTDGGRITDAQELARIRALAIPPAWTHDWICPQPNGHILATGRDAKGRKQYRYHPRWRSVRDEAKFERVVTFAEKLPALRRRVRKDMALTGLPKERVVATVVALLDCCFARIGNEQYARTNGSFGLTTLRDRHARFDGSGMRLRYRGKSGKDHDAHIDDRRIVHIVRKCQDVPGQVLFQYLDDDGTGAPVSSDDVNAYLRDVTGEEFSAKDFRTWAGTVTAVSALVGAEAPATKAEAAQRVVAAIDEVADQLGNTRAVARSSYVHPDVIAGFEDGSLAAAWSKRNGARTRGLSADERFTLSFLRARARKHRRSRAA